MVEDLWCVGLKGFPWHEAGSIKIFLESDFRKKTLNRPN